MFDWTGRIIDGKYRLVRLLGEGGMGAVYEAHHEILLRSVAVKLLWPAFAADQDAVRRFHREAQAAGRIGHDNICEVLDLGTTPEGVPFMVMPLLKGETLSKVIVAGRGVPLERTADILSQTLAALAAAHRAGIVHRDLKPDNVFITSVADRRDLVKILDFGVAKILGAGASASVSNPNLTKTGAIVGTAAYMSPEQARGAKDIDHRTDIYAVGAILYEMLTGARMYEGETYNEVLHKIFVGKVRPPRELRPDVPRELEAVAMRAVARQPADRFQDASAFRLGLQRACEIARIPIGAGGTPRAVPLVRAGSAPGPLALPKPPPLPPPPALPAPEPPAADEAGMSLAETKPLDKGVLKEVVKAAAAAQQRASVPTAPAAAQQRASVPTAPAVFDPGLDEATTLYPSPEPETSPTERTPPRPPSGRTIPGVSAGTSATMQSVREWKPRWVPMIIAGAAVGLALGAAVWVLVGDRAGGEGPKAPPAVEPAAPLAASPRPLRPEPSVERPVPEPSTAPAPSLTAEAGRDAGLVVAVAPPPPATVSPPGADAYSPPPSGVSGGVRPPGIEPGAAVTMPAEAAAASPDAASAGAVETVDVAGRVEELLAEGRRAFEAHDWLRARASFEEAMEMAPRDRRAQAWLGRTAFQQGRFGEAARLLEPIYRDEGNVDLGKAYVRVGRIQEARRQFELVLQRAPNHAEAREALAALESPPASRDAALRTDAGASGAAAADAARRVADAGTDAASEAIRRSFEGDARAVSASPRGDAGTSGGIRRAYGDE